MRRHARAGAPPWLHQEVARRMADKLEFIRAQPMRVMNWWAHLGGGREALTQRYPSAQRWDVEPHEAWRAASMAHHHRPWWHLHAHLKRGPSVSVPLESDENAWRGQADLLWANMMMHWVDDIPSLMQCWHRALRPEGFVMFSCFGPDTVRELRALYARADWPVPTVLFTDMHDLGDMLVQAGFAEPVMDMERITLTWATPQALMLELRALGGNASPQRGAGLRTPRWSAQWLSAIDAHCRDAQGRVALSFEIIYGHAFRGVPRGTQGLTQVSLSELRGQLPSQRLKI